MLNSGSFYVRQELSIASALIKLGPRSTKNLFDPLSGAKDELQRQVHLWRQ